MELPKKKSTCCMIFINVDKFAWNLEPLCSSDLNVLFIQNDW